MFVQGQGFWLPQKIPWGYWCLEVIDALCSASVQNEKRKWNHELIKCIFPFQTCGNKTAYCFRITAPVQQIICNCVRDVLASREKFLELCIPSNCKVMYDNGGNLAAGLVSPATDNHASRALCVHPSNIPPLNIAYSLRNRNF